MLYQLCATGRLSTLFSFFTEEQQAKSASHPTPLQARQINHGRHAMSVDSIEKLFIEELKDLYSAENQITKALPKMVNAATSKDLKKAFENHLRETEAQIERLVQVCKMLGTSPKGKSCEGMKGVLQEGSSMLHESEEGDVRDAALISAAQRVEHYEMAAYGTVRSYAQLLGQTEVAKLLEETLEEEKAADQKLTSIAQKVNVKAQQQA
jgi:ferritin-like metal-binding protein YciE